MVLRAERIETDRDLVALHGEWTALQPAHPFQRGEWLSAWWEHLRADSLRVRDELYAWAVRDSHGALVAVAPLMRSLRPGSGPVNMRVVQPFGTDPNITELRTLPCRPGCEEPALQALLAQLRSRSAEWDWVELGAIRSGSPAEAALERETGIEWSEHQSEYVLPLAATWEEQRARLSRNIKESLRKCYNSLKRAGLAWELRVAQSPAEVAAALPRFFELHAARAKIATTVRHRDVFASGPARSFLEDVCQRLAASGHARIFELVIGEETVASRIGLLQGDSLYLYFSGFAPAYGVYSVMTTTVSEAIQWAIRERLASVNFSFGGDVSKLRWGPDEIVWRSAVLPSSALRSQIARRTFRTAVGLLGSSSMRRIAGRGV